MTDFKAKLHQIRFRLGLRPRPRCGSLPPSCIWGRFAAGEGCWGRGVKVEGEGGGSGGEGKGGPQVTVEPGHIRALLRHWGNHLPVSFP